MKFDTSKFDRQTIIKLSLVVILVIVAYFVIRKAVKTIKGDSLQNKLDAEIEANKLSYPLNQYVSLADQFDASFTLLTTDEKTIYGIFKKMNTLSDVLQLNKAFGQRNFYGFFGSMSMAGFIQRGMSADEIAEVNKILSKNNINFSF